MRVKLVVVVICKFSFRLRVGRKCGTDLDRLKEGRDSYMLRGISDGRGR